MFYAVILFLPLAINCGFIDICRVNFVLWKLLLFVSIIHIVGLNKLGDLGL